MWACDLICDISWLKANKGHLGEPTFVITGSSNLLKGSIEILLFGDEIALHHVRFILHTNDKDLAQKCINANIIAWVNSIEAGVMLQTKRSFSVPKIDGVSMFATVLIDYTGGEHVTVSLDLNPNIIPLDLKVLGLSLAIWRPDCHTHLFFFRRMLDPAIPLESRWHNAYKLFEWHFAKQNLKRHGKKK